MELRSGSLQRRAIWTALDQGVSSLGNAGLSLVVAREVSATEFGAFAIAFSVFVFSISASASFSGQVVSILFADAEGARATYAARTSTGSALGFGLLIGVLLCFAASLLPDDLRPVLLCLAISLPFLLMQDTWRAVLLARARPLTALLADSLGLLSLGCFCVLLIAWDVEAAYPFVLAWGASGLVASVLCCAKNRVLPTFRGLQTWVSETRSVGFPTFGSAMATLGAAQISFVLIAAIGSLQDVGSLRGAQTLLGPLNILSFAAAAFVLPEVSRRRLTRAEYVQWAAWMSTVLLIVHGLWVVVLLFLPDSLGVALLGDTWVEARACLPGFGVYLCGIAATAGATTVVRGLNRADLALVVSVVLGVLVLVLPVAGVYVGGASGAAFGFAIAALCSVLPAWLLLLKAARTGRRTKAPSAP
ncbi:oligosaccharide flippase family protein [Actinomycetospora sp. NBRC 106375]|uniref:oligosaccharide flippase family protein n=1 Tax=Actinomycetospora sp. NBRC 106375 TaxID=3032207 RepID=UPI00331FB75C